MTDRDALQEQLRVNIKVLMAMKGIETVRALAEALGDHHEVHVGHQLKGKRRWTLDDLADLGRVFGVEPSMLLGDTAKLVSALGPMAAAKDEVTRTVTVQYLLATIPQPRRPPQATALSGRYRPVTLPASRQYAIG